MSKRAAIYARLSVAAEESVSIERQLEACRKYAEARGWEVVLVATDDGVSATKKRPEDRDGWSEVLVSAPRVDVVIVWKVDRLSRRVLDFLHADASLQEAGAGLVAVEDPIDMTTAQGRAFATMLAVFGEMEAAAISARVTSATRHLKREGRVSGGERPWPFEAARREDGPGLVLVPIAERAEAIQEAARALIAGEVSSAEVGRRWDALGLAPKGKKRNGQDPRPTWSPSSVRAILRNPTIYGATLYRGKPLRGPDGSVRIGPHEILDRMTWERLQRALDGGSTGRREDRPALLSRLVFCGSCERQMGPARPSTRPESAHRYRCQERACKRPLSISLPRLDEYVSSEYLARYGSFDAIEPTISTDGPDPAALQALEADLLDVEDALRDTDDDDEALTFIRRRKALRADLARLQDAPTTERVTYRTLDVSTAEVFERGDLDVKRTLLASALVAVEVLPGAPGRHGLDAERVSLTWRGEE